MDRTPQLEGDPRSAHRWRCAPEQRREAAERLGVGLSSPPETRSPTRIAWAGITGKGRQYARAFRLQRKFPEFRQRRRGDRGACFQGRGGDLGAWAGKGGCLGRAARGRGDPGDLHRRLSQLSGVCDAGGRGAEGCGTLPGVTSL